MRKIYPPSFVGRNALAKYRSLVLLGWFVAFMLVSAMASAATVTATLSTVTVNWAAIGWSPSAPVAGDDIVITCTGNPTINAVPGTAFGSLTFTASGGNRTVAFNTSSGASFTSVTCNSAGAGQQMNLNSGGARLNTSNISILATSASFVSFNFVGYTLGGDMNLTLNGADHSFRDMADGNGVLTITSLSNRSLNLSSNVAASFTRIQVQGSFTCNVNIAGSNIRTNRVNIFTTTASGFNWGGSSGGWGAGNAMVVGLSGANHTVSSPGAFAYGKLTIENNDAATARNCTLNLGQAATFTDVALTSINTISPGLVLAGGNRLTTTTTSGKINVSGKGILNFNTHATYTSGTEVVVAIAGGDFTVNGFINTQTGLDFNFTADGVARTCTLNAPSTGSHDLVQVGANVTYRVNATTILTSGVTGSGNVLQSSVLTINTPGEVNISGDYTQVNTLTANGNFTVGGTLNRTGNVATTYGGNVSIGTYTTVAAPTTAPLTINGSGTQTLAWGGSPVFNAVTINSSGALTLAGNLEQRGNLAFTNASTFTQTSGTWLTALGGAAALTNTGGKIITFNNLSVSRTGSSPVYTVSTSFTVNGTFTGNNAGSSFTFGIPASGPYTFTFNGAYDQDPGGVNTDWNAVVPTTATFYHKLLFKGPTVNFGDITINNYATGGGNVNAFDLEFQAPSGGMTVSSVAFHGTTTSGLVARNFIISGSNNVTWDCAHTLHLYGNVVNNSTATFQPTKGDALQTVNNGDRFFFIGTGTQTIGTAGGALLALNGITAGSTSTVQLLQNVGLYNGHSGGTAFPQTRTFGVQAGGKFDFNGFTVTLDRGAAAGKSQQIVWSANAGDIICTSGGVYYASLPTQAEIVLTNPQSIAELRVSGTNGCLINSGLNIPLTITGTLTLESNLTTNSNNNTLVIGNSSKIVRRTGTLTRGTALAIVYPTAPNFYDLVYDGSASVSQGLEWDNTAVVRNLTIGPEVGISNATGVDVPTVSARTIRGNLILNSNAATALSSNVGIPIASGSTIFRYGTGTVDRALNWGATINIHYGGNFSTGPELPTGGSANVLNNLTIAPGSGNTVTLATNASVGGDLTITSGNFDLDAFTADRQSAGGSLSLAAGSTLFIGGTGDFPANFSGVTLAPTSTVVYDGDAQTITPRQYPNLTVTGARGANNITFPSGTVEVTEVFTPSATFSGGNYIVDAANTVLFSGADGQSIPGFNYNNLSSSNNNRTLVGTIGIASVFTPGSGAYTTIGSTVDYNGSGAQTVEPLNYHNLTLSGSRGANSITLSGTVSVGGAFSPTATFSSGSYVTTGSTVAFVGGSQTVPNIPGVGYAGLNINQATGSATMAEPVTVTGTLTLTAGKLITSSHNLTIGQSGSISVTSPSGTKMIDLAGGGAVIKEFNAPSGVSFLYPIGTGSGYTPANLANFSATGTGSVTVNVYNINSPSVADPLVAMDRYWNVSVSGLTITNVDPSFTYLASDVVGSEGSYVARRFGGGVWNNVGASIVSRVISATGLTTLAGEWTAGEPAAFVVVTIYFSLGGDWHTASSWSTAGFGGAPAGAAPIAGDIVQIGDGKTITVGSSLAEAGSVQIQATGILQFNDVPNASNNLGTVTGTGVLRYNNSTGSAVTFPAGSFGTFLSSSGGTVEYAGTGSYTLPTQANYNRLTIAGSGTKTLNSAITTVGTLTVSSGVTFVPTSTLNINAGVVLDGTITQTSGSTVFGSGATQAISGTASSGYFGPITIAAGTSLNITANSTATSGTLTNNSDATFAINATAGTFTLGNASGSHTISGSGVGALVFNNLAVASGTSYSTAKDITIRGTFTNNSNGVTGVSFNQTAGLTTFSGGTTQAVDGAGTGSVTFNEVTISGATTLAPTASFIISGNLNTNSSSGAMLDATGGKITFTGTNATIDGSGSGTVTFYDLGIAGSGRLTSNKDLRLRRDIDNSSTGQSGVSMNVTGVEFGIGGIAPQMIAGTGTGNLVFGDFVILPGAMIAATSSIAIEGNITNQSNGLSGKSFDQTSGTTTLQGTSVQTISATGTGSIHFNNLAYAGASRTNVTTDVHLYGNLSSSSTGISGVTISATAGSFIFGGGTTQTMTRTGSGTFEFTGITVGTASRLNITTDLSVAGALTINSAGIGSPATAFSHTSGTLTFNGSVAQSIGGAGAGRLQLNNIIVASGPSRINLNRDIYLAGSYTNNSTGISGAAIDAASGTTTFINGTASQAFGGTVGTNVTRFHNVEIVSGAGVAITNGAFTVRGNFVNNSNGISGNSWHTATSGGAMVMDGGTTQNISGSGTGVITFRGLTVASGTRVNCVKDFTIFQGSTAFNGSGLGVPAKVFEATAGTVTIRVAGGGQNFSGGSGLVEFYNLTLAEGSPGSYPLNKGFSVAEVLSTTGGLASYPLSTTSDITLSAKDLVLNNTLSGGITVGVGSANRNHTINISGNVSASGSAGGLLVNARRNGAFTMHTTVNLTGSTGTLSGSGNALFSVARLNVNGNYTNTISGTGGVVVGVDSSFYTCSLNGSGTWTQGTNGRMTISLPNSGFTLPFTSFIPTGTGNTLILNSSLADARNLPGASFQNLTLNNPGGSWVPAGNTTVGGNFTLTAGGLPMGTNNISFGGSTTFTGAMSIGANTVTFAGNVAQDVPALTYTNLVKTGTGTASLLGNAVVTSALTIGDGNLNLGANTLTLGVNPGDNISITRGTGSLSAAPTFISGANYSYTYNSTTNANVNIGVEMLPASNTTDLANLTINHTGSPANQVVMTDNMTLNGALTLTAGQLNMGSRTLFLKGTSVTRTAGTITSINGASGSELVFNGSGSMTLPNGLFTSSPAGFKNITMNRGAGAEVTFGNQDLNITGLVTLGAAGFLNTGSSKFDLGTTGELSGEANDRYVRGNVEAERAVVLPASTINFANMGVRMKDYTQNVGANLRVLRSAGVAASISPGNSPGLSGNSSARTRWSVTNVAVQPTAGIQLELTWFGDNDNVGGCGACNVNSMAIFTRPTASDPWERMRLGNVWTNADAGGGLRRLYVNAKHFSDFTPGYEAAPLPIVLASLRGTVVKQGVRLIWNTLQEKNGSHFQVERRDAGQTEFTTVGRVEAVGNSSTINSYNFLDAGHEGNAYYRLKMVDQDGSWEYSTMAYVSRATTDRTLAVVPNPARDLVILNTTGIDMAASMATSILGADGRILWQAEGTVQQLQAQMNAMMPELPAGAYMIRIMDGSGVLNTKFVKQ